MSHAITIDLDKLTPAEAEILAGFIITFAEGKASGFTSSEDPAPAPPAPPAIDPAAAFGSAPAGKIAEAGPTLVIPVPPADPQNAGIVQSTPAPAIPSVSTAGVTLDKDGLPWDVRIHASSKAQNADGTWRLKRGLAKDHLDKVTVELRQVMAIPSPAAGPQLVPPPPPPAQTAAAASAPPPPPAVANGADARDQFIALFNRVSAAISQGKITEAHLTKCLEGIGVPSLPLLGARLDLVPQACALIDGVIAGASA